MKNGFSVGKFGKSPGNVYRKRAPDPDHRERLPAAGPERAEPENVSVFGCDFSRISFYADANLPLPADNRW